MENSIVLDKKIKDRILSLFKNSSDILDSHTLQKIEGILEKTNITAKELGRIYNELYNKTDRLSFNTIFLDNHHPELREEFHEEAEKISAQFKQMRPLHDSRYRK